MPIIESAINNIKSIFRGAPDKITGDEENEDLVSKLDSLFDLCKPQAKNKLKWVEDNLKLYEGKHWDTRKKPTYKSDIVMNLEFMGVETVTPIMTDRQPTLLCLPADDREDSKDLAKNIEKMITYHWRRLSMDLLTPQIVRHMLVYRDAILHWKWNYYKNDVDIELLHPNNFYADPNARSMEEVEYCFKVVPRCLKYIKENYPEKAEEMENNWQSEFLEGEDRKKAERRNQILVKEFWGYTQRKQGKETKYEMRLITYAHKVVLSNRANPYWDNEGVLPAEAKENLSAQYGDLAIVPKEKITEEKRYYNHFLSPRFPFIVIPTFTFGDSLYSKTSIVEQTKKLQQSINKRKSQISDNADLMANGIWLVSAEAGIDPNNIINKPGVVIEASGGDISPAKIRRETGVPLPPYVFDDMRHSQQIFDNLFGAHDISRGQTGSARTATEASILKEADQGRIALLIRNLKAGFEELGNAWVHLMKLFYDDEHYGSLLGKEGAEHIKLTRDEIPDNIEVIVKAGSTVPIDRIAQRQESKDLFMAKAFDPITLYERLGDIDNPKESAERLDKWLKGTLFEEAPPPMPEGGLPPEQMPPVEGMLPAEGMPPEGGEAMPGGAPPAPLV